MEARKWQPKTVNLASITARNWEDRKNLSKIRQSNDQYLLPRDQYGNVAPKLEDWPFGNCSEMNAWTYLCQWRPDLQIKSQTIIVHSREIMEPCKNCKAIQNWLTD